MKPNIKIMNNNGNPKIPEHVYSMIDYILTPFVQQCYYIFAFCSPSKLKEIYRKREKTVQKIL